MNANRLARRARKVHLDFHTAPFVRDVAMAFDADEFVATLQEALVNAVVVSAKCHHGMAYYPTRVGARHPHLARDLLGEMVDALRAADIAVTTYYSVCWDEAASHGNPDWCQVDAAGRPQQYDNWKALCLSSPYVEELVLPQVGEIAQMYRPDGFWFDILIRGDGCHCTYCRRPMAAEGLDVGQEADRRTFNGRVDARFMAKVTATVKGILPEVMVAYNQQVRVGARAIVRHLDLLEIEALPAEWGYLFYPLYARYARTLGIPYSGLTARFHGGWGDFGSLKSVAQLQYEAATILANGGLCSIGDQLHPNGRLDRTVYEVIGQTYRFVEEREAWCLPARSLAEVALLVDDQPSSLLGPVDPGPNIWGAAKMLLEAHIPFDVVDAEADLSRYRLVILPDNRSLPPGAIGRIQAFLASGGRLLLTHLATYDPVINDFALAEEMGISFRGLSPYSLSYLQVTDEALGRGVPTMPLVVHDPFVQVEVRDVQILARTVHPLTERTPERFTSHRQAPPARSGIYPAITYRPQVGIYLASPLFATYYAQGNTIYRRLVENCIALLLSDPLLTTDAGPSVEVSLMAQPNRWLIHLVNYHTEKRGLSPEVIEEIPPRFQIGLKVRTPFRPSRVSLAPGGEAVAWHANDEYVTVTVPRLDIHQIVVLEQEEAR